MQIANGQNVGSWYFEPRPDITRRVLAREGPEHARHGVRNDRNFGAVDSICAFDAAARKLAGSQNECGVPDSAPYAPPQLKRARRREELRMLQIADIVNRDDDGNRAAKWSCVLHVHQIGTILAQFLREIEAEPREGIAG